MRSTALGSEPLARLATTLTLALAIPGAATAGATPDPAQIAAMREAIAGAPVLLVRGDFGVREFHRARVDSDGVSAHPESRRTPRPGVFVTADAPPPAVPSAIPWSEITSLETQRPKKLQGAVGGLVIGLALGLTLALNYDSTEEDWTAVGFLIGTPMLGAFAGTIIGSFSGTKVIYRAPTQEKP